MRDLHLPIPSDCHPAVNASEDIALWRLESWKYDHGLRPRVPLTGICLSLGSHSNWTRNKNGMSLALFSPLSSPEANDSTSLNESQGTSPFVSAKEDMRMSPFPID